VAATFLQTASNALLNIYSRPAPRRFDDAALVRMLDTEVIPRLTANGTLKNLDYPAESLSATSRPTSTRDKLVEGLASLAAAQQRKCAMELLVAVLDSGWPLRSVYLELLQPAARLLGEYWEGERCDFVEVSLGTAFLQRLMRELSTLHGNIDPVPGHHHRILLLPAPGEQHIFGISMLGEFFRSAGWDVCGGPRIEEPEVLQLVRQEQFDVIGYSAATERALEPLAAQIDLVRRNTRVEHLKILAGGNAVSSDSVALQLGADATAGDAGQAVDAASLLVRDAVPEI
jgi:methanogenic corrinoid protein MtbC1